MGLFTDEEFQKIPIAAHGKIQEYQVGVEARFDEDELAITTLNEQLMEPVTIKEEKPRRWWRFWE